jgi:hypothetical protein
MKLLWAMGYELANVHLGSCGSPSRLRTDLRRRKSNWMRRAVETMVEATLDDWKDWRKHIS